MPLLHKFDAEDSHNYSIQAAKYGLVPKDKTGNDPILSVNVYQNLMIDFWKAVEESNWISGRI